MQAPDGGTQYEILHDVLGPALLQWQNRYKSVQEEAAELAAAQAAFLQARAQALRTRRCAAGLAHLLLLALTAVGWAFFERSNAQSDRNTALQREQDAVEAQATAEESAAEAERQKLLAEAAQKKAQENADEAQSQTDLASRLLIGPWPRAWPASPNC